MRKNSFDKVGVIGSGTMGSAIAQHFLMKGLEVVMVDINLETLKRGKATIGVFLSEAVERRVIKEDGKNEMLGRLHLSASYESLKNCSLVIEAVFEDLEVKRQVFIEAEKWVGPKCVLASNTSSFPISELAKPLSDPSRFLGVHYFYHAAKNKLVEIIPGRETSDETTEKLYEHYFLWDKIPIIVKDVPGFAVNRFFVPWLNEASRLLEEGFGSIASIDQLTREVFGLGAGPFALMNMTGIPIAMHASKTLSDHFGEFYSPSATLKRQVESRNDWDLESRRSGNLNGEVITDRLMAVTFGIASQIVSEGVCDPWETDLGARIGLRWPLGPFELMNRIGLSRSKKMVESLFSRWDMPLPDFLKEASGKKNILLDQVHAHRIGETGVIEICRPDQMNALDVLTVDQLSERFLEFQDDPGIKRIIFMGRGKAFVAGASVKFFLERIEADDYQGIDLFTQKGQTLFKRIAESKKPTMAYLDGMALGGGLELALACQYRAATERLYMAFPETSLGIYPALGGTQRTARLIGKARTKFLIATATGIGADKALQMGLIDKIIPRTASLSEIAGLTFPVGRPEIKETDEWDFFGDFKGVVANELFLDERFKPYEKALLKKAPLALKKAMELIDQGESLSLEEALKLELDSLIWMFKTQDAKRGLQSLISGEKPAFEGK